MGARLKKNFFFFFSKLAARALDVLAGVHLDFFHATDFGGSEHSEEKVYEVYFMFELSWSAVDNRTENCTEHLAHKAAKVVN